MKRTLQEWADFTGLYSCLDNGEYPRPVRFSRQKPAIKETKVMETIIENWTSTDIEMFGKSILDVGMFHLCEKDITPFPGDWRDSLHSPRVMCPECDGSGRKKSCNSECGLRRRFPVSCKEQMCPWIMCQTCHGAGWVEREEV